MSALFRGRAYSPQGDYSVGGGLAGGLSGAATGAAFGSAVPVVGTALGAIVGGVVGLAGGFSAGAPSLVGPVTLAVREMVYQGLIPSDKKIDKKQYFKGLLAIGDPTAIAYAKQFRVDIPAALKSYKGKQQVSPIAIAATTTTDEPEMATGACACDDRPRQVLAMLVQALQSDPYFSQPNRLGIAPGPGGSFF